MLPNLTGKVNKKGEVEGIDRVLLADSTATTIGALAGTSNTTSYIESGAGIKEGGKTGLTAVTVAVLFALCLVLAPLAQSIHDLQLHLHWSLSLHTSYEILKISIGKM